MPLEISKELEDIKNYYENDIKQSTFSALVLGESGSGKTFLIRTARKPVFIDSFDPGGTRALKDLISSNDIVVDTRWENEDPLKPSVYKEWKATFDRRVREKFFNQFATYVLDSVTTWSDAIMNDVLRKAGIAGEAPRFTKDYTPQKNEIKNYLNKMLRLPCDFLALGHLKLVEDPVEGAVYRFMTTGQGMVTIPLMFDEIYVMSPKQTSSGIEYRMLTNSTGKYVARSRLCSNGKLDAYEKPDISNILKKVGYDYKRKEV
jgi:hypothetical protein